MVNSSEELSDLHKQLIEDLSKELVLKEKEKQYWEQHGDFVLANNCIERIEELKQKISEYKSKLNPYYKHGSLLTTLLNQDFLPQKKEWDNKVINRIGSCILMQGTPSCGLHYFLMHKHSNCAVRYIKADDLIVRETGEKAVWQEITKILGMPELDVINTRKHIPTAISERLEAELKEKPKVFIVHSINSLNKELWGFLEKVVTCLVELPIDPSLLHPFYCYFINTINKNESDCCYLNNNDNLIILPQVDNIPLNEVEHLFSNFINDKLFCKHFGCESFKCKCLSKTKEFSSKPRRLAEVIDFVCEHSIYGQELRNHFNKFPCFS